MESTRACAYRAGLVALVLLVAILSELLGYDACTPLSLQNHCSRCLARLHPVVVSDLQLTTGPRVSIQGMVLLLSAYRMHTYVPLRHACVTINRTADSRSTMPAPFVILLYQLCTLISCRASPLPSLSMLIHHRMRCLR